MLRLISNWYHSGKRCREPQNPEHGTWICDTMSAPLASQTSGQKTWEEELNGGTQGNGQKMLLTKNDMLLSALRCQLECDPGYVSDLNPVLECTHGSFEPESPSMFFCEPAVALIITKDGKREVFSNDALSPRVAKNV